MHSYNPALDAVSHILSLVCLRAVIHCRFADQFVIDNQVATIAQTIKFFLALEKRAAFFYIALASKRAGYQWDVQNVGEDATSIRYFC